MLQAPLGLENGNVLPYSLPWCCVGTLNMQPCAQAELETSNENLKTTHIFLGADLDMVSQAISLLNIVSTRPSG